MKLRALTIGAAAVVVGMVGGQATYAQLNNSGSSLGSGRISEGDLTIAARPNEIGSAGAPRGPGISRLKLTTPEVMPYTGFAAPAAVDLGEPGTSLDSKYDKEAFGTAPEQWPYSTSRVAVTGVPGPGSGSPQIPPTTSLPYRISGKLWMRFGSSWFVCTASLIKKGVAVTAAHCVHNYGQGAAGFADEVRFYPANWTDPASGGGPYGYFSGLIWRVPSPYVNGTDTCQSGAIGIVCNNDIATVTLSQKGGKHAGEFVGSWYGYSWNGYSFPNSPAFGNHRVGDITQLGYPVALDNGYQMERNNSFGKLIFTTGANGKQLRNIELGSAMTGGSSGGPWLVNFGTTPTVTGGASLGQHAVYNVVVGVTSWGYTAVGVNVQGSSMFGQNAEYPNADYGGYGAGNIGALVRDTCAAHPSHC